MNPMLVLARRHAGGALEQLAEVFGILSGRAASAGIIKGKDGDAFAPKDFATRAESAVMLRRMLSFIGFINE